MKVFVQDATSTAFYSYPGAWVLNKNEATDFRLVERAIQEACHLGLPGLQIVLSYENPVCDLILSDWHGNPG